MNDQSNNRPNNSGQNNNNGSQRRHHNGARPHNGQNNANAPRPSNNRPNDNRPRNPNGQNSAAHNPNATGPNPNANRNNNRRRNNRNKNRNSARRPNPNRSSIGPVPNSERRPPHLDRAYEKYQNLLDQHIIARKKYFELFYRADFQQKAKLERNFYQTLFDLRDFEEKATPEISDFLKIKTNGKSPDLIYSDNHSLEKDGKIEIIGDNFEDPHFLPSQAKANYDEDTEESVGSLEDYNKYKGL